MNKIKRLFNNKFPLILIFFGILFVLILLGQSFPKGIYGIKPIKTVTYIVLPGITQFQNADSDSTNIFIRIFFILLIILTILYLIFNPLKALSYAIAIFILLFIFIALPSLIKYIDHNKDLNELQKDQQQQEDNKVEEQKNSDEYREYEILPYTPPKNKFNYKLFYIIISVILIGFTSFFLLLFIINFIKKIMEEIKEGKFSIGFYNKKKKKVLIEEVNRAIYEAIDLIDTGNSVKDAIINCYLALLYSVKKYAKKIKEPGLTSREFEPVLISIGLDKLDIEKITTSFEKAKYSSQTISEDEKNMVLKSLKNCILRLKKSY